MERPSDEAIIQALAALIETGVRFMAAFNTVAVLHDDMAQAALEYWFGDAEPICDHAAMRAQAMHSYVKLLRRAATDIESCRAVKDALPWAKQKWEKLHPDLLADLVEIDELEGEERK